MIEDSQRQTCILVKPYPHNADAITSMSSSEANLLNYQVSALATTQSDLSYQPVRQCTDLVATACTILILEDRDVVKLVDFLCGLFSKTIVTFPEDIN